MKINKKDARNWLFKGLMFEAEAEQFRSAGIRVGFDTSESEREMLKEVLSPFSINLRNEALRMARLYALLYCFENSVRVLITQRLQEKYGLDWWKVVPVKISSFAEKRQKDALDNSWLEGQNKHLIDFVDFGHLADIITQKWDDFSDLITSQQWIKQRMDEIEKARHFIAHNRFLLPNEFQRIEMYINDWNRMVGL